MRSQRATSLAHWSSPMIHTLLAWLDYHFGGTAMIPHNPYDHMI